MKFNVVIKAFILVIILQVSFRAYAAQENHIGYALALIANPNKGTLVFSLDTNAPTTCATNGGIWGQFEIDATDPANDRMIQLLTLSHMTKSRLRVEYDDSSCGTDTRMKQITYIQSY